MKTTLKLSSIATAVAIVSVMASCQNKETKGTTTKTTDAVAVSDSEKIVYVNSDSLLTKYQYFKDLKVKLDGKSKTAQSDLVAKQDAFKREVAQYQQQANTLPADQRAATEERLARKQQELQAYSQNAGAALQNEQAAENEKLYDKVADYLKVYAKKKGYKMVLGYSKGNGTILFADESLDVTSEVIIGLNEAYKK
ncbi:MULTISPECIES: OmpH family outer membrane protein [Pedobacter]|uniref:Outer membrane chaperone Skp (OmpH) n=1 Tax=Pedobacter heparinus (strain ATCC 13125 / DSM 2366 / CIP 104194 / JCM 7457 / NBRC 12017 / NCIMB 9290 / NRRL B-14731 / HIM 762-3) TaxID=485917 RepID=C6Y290_PEDHD|nr:MULTISPECIES: OmpH family outer membrane protein [Pedobacter]ACU03083.1 outer membrane chaperone Skp (OmpH) [Pedobacter heparinus DSM 2366]MBB5438462.1 outer membrane protein [Pedobacter sp. AK017]